MSTDTYAATGPRRAARCAPGTPRAATRSPTLLHAESWQTVPLHHPRSKRVRRFRPHSPPRGRVAARECSTTPLLAPTCAIRYLCVDWGLSPLIGRTARAVICGTGARPMRFGRRCAGDHVLLRDHVDVGIDGGARWCRGGVGRGRGHRRVPLVQASSTIPSVSTSTEEGNVWVVNGNRNEQSRRIAARPADLLFRWARPSGRVPVRPTWATALAVGPNPAKVYLGDIGNAGVDWFDLDGNFLGSFGNSSNFSNLRGIAVAGER